MMLWGSASQAHLTAHSHHQQCAMLPRLTRSACHLRKSAHSHLGCLSTTAIDEPRELARMDCPPGLLVGPQRPL